MACTPHADTQLTGIKSASASHPPECGACKFLQVGPLLGKLDGLNNMQSCIPAAKQNKTRPLQHAACRPASDTQAVCVCAQRECGVRDFLRVAPLFETLDDLNNCEGAMRQLLENEWYKGLIKGTQECMIGYSDSGKDAGRMAAAWGLYEVQVQLLCPNVTI